MWISSYCFSCIFQLNDMKTMAKSDKYYIIRFSPNGTLDIFEKMNDIDFLFQSLVDIVKKTIHTYIHTHSLFSNAGQWWQLLQLMWTYLGNTKIYYFKTYRALTVLFTITRRNLFTIKGNNQLIIDRFVAHFA